MEPRNGDRRVDGTERDAQDELEQSLATLESSLRRRQSPNRFHARAILLALGHRLLAGEVAPLGLSERLTLIIGPRDEERWSEVVREELTLAATEHVRAVDPRYLAHRDYDFAYTVAARAELEARLRAAEELGQPASEDLLDRVVQADELLRPYLENRGKGSPG
jgi:hypothetical protein